ncbi:hypothetical protein PUN28_015711 [Cardiocondyla obscurior]|uniref:Uncharacterized protein n=1 Tax=Cardiocondyla obscurior TaxID=286306 RepID=A0AAW2EUC4_9HYME
MNREAKLFPSQVGNPTRGWKKLRDGARKRNQITKDCGEKCPPPSVPCPHRPTRAVCNFYIFLFLIISRNSVSREVVS